MADTAIIEEDRAGKLQEARTKDQAKARARRRMMASPPNFAEYALVGTIALINDLTDYVFGIFEATGIGYIILKIVDIATGAILLTWAYWRGVERMQNTGRANRIWRMIFAWLIELIPFLGALSPTWTISVYLAYRKHQKLATEGVRQRAKETSDAAAEPVATTEATAAENRESEALPEAA